MGKVDTANCFIPLDKEMTVVTQSSTDEAAAKGKQEVREMDTSGPRVSAKPLLSLKNILIGLQIDTKPPRQNDTFYKVRCCKACFMFKL